MKTDPADAIRSLGISNSVHQSMVGRVRSLLPAITDAQLAGVRLSDIANTLRTHGFENMDLKCLQNLLYQARRRNKRSQAAHDQPRVAPICTAKTSIKDGIDADFIFELARKSMTSRKVSGVTLDLLHPSTQTKGN